MWEMPAGMVDSETEGSGSELKMLKEACKVFTALGPDGQICQLEVLADGGPLCVAGIWDWEARRLIQGLYWIYFKRAGVHFGPFYASLTLAESAMKKALKIQAGLWDQDREWYRHQAWLQEWIDKNLGKSDWLIGGAWAKD